MGIHNIAIRLKEKGVQVVVIAPFSSRKLPNLPYEVVTLPPKIFQIYKYIPVFLCDQIFGIIYNKLQKKYNFDIWHITMGYPAGVSFVNYSLKFKIPYLVRCAGSDIQVSSIAKYGERRNLKIDNLIKKSFIKMPFLISISNSVYNEYKKININDKCIKSIPNGVNTSLFSVVHEERECILKKYNIPEDFKIFLSVGRNHFKKNFKLLFKIAYALKKRNFTNFIFIIVGDHTSSLKHLITPDLKDNFLIINSFGLDFDNGLPIIPHRKLISLYQISDLFVFPSFIETFGIVIVEAMAASLPIITSNVEGCRDLITNNVNGFLCNPENEEEFANNIILLLSDKEKYEEFQFNNKNKALEYDWDLIVGKYVELYKEVIMDCRKRI